MNQSCAKCGYPLDGLLPAEDGMLICPECAHDQGQVPARKQWWRGPLTCVAASAPIQVACWVASNQLWRHGVAYDMQALLIFGSPFAGAVAGAASGYAATRRQAPARRSRRRRIWLWLLLAAVLSVVVWIALLPIAFFLTSNGTMLGC